jgi:SAM-dependent methyltransferase
MLAVRVSDRSRQSEEQLIRDNQLYWQDRSSKVFEPFSHWRGKGPFENDELWLGLGRAHLELFEKATAWSEPDGPIERIVEWGCGGGMNAVQFAPRAREYYGVDISADSLAECAKQCAAVKAESFVPVLIEATDPDGARAQIHGPVDLFISTYVFELIPSPEYGLRLLQLAYDLLRQGGIALVQVRYHSGRLHELSKRTNYNANLVRMTTYALDELWTACEDIGFYPAFIKLVPEQPELGEERYAYYVLVK